MFRLWRLKYQRWRVGRISDREYKSLIRRKASRDEFAQHEAEEYFAYREIEEQIDRLRALDLWRKGNDLDIEMPPTTEEAMWIHSEDGQHTFLSAKGRAHVRRLVHEERTRQFELRYGYFVKIVIPLLGLIVALIGALTGYIAVKQR